MRLLAESLQQTNHPGLMGPAAFGALMLMLGADPATEADFAKWDAEEAE